MKILLKVLLFAAVILITWQGIKLSTWLANQPNSFAVSGALFCLIVSGFFWAECTRRIFGSSVKCLYNKIKKEILK